MPPFCGSIPPLDLMISPSLFSHPTSRAKPAPAPRVPSPPHVLALQGHIHVCPPMYRGAPTPAAAAAVLLALCYLVGRAHQTPVS